MSTIGSMSTADVNTGTITTDEITVTESLFDTTPKYTPTDVLPVPLLKTTEDLIIFTSVICGFLVVMLVLAFIGWVSDQTEQFGDPFGKKLRYTTRTNMNDDQIRPVQYDSFPRVQLTTDDNNGFPSWIAHDQNRNHVGTENAAYDEIETSMRAQHEAAKEINEIVEDLSDSEYEECHVSPVNQRKHQESRDIKPSAVKEYERSKSAKNKDKNVYDAQISVKGESHQQEGVSSPITSTPSTSKHYPQAQRSDMYETSLHGIDDDEQCEENQYSNHEIPPVIPPRQ